MFDMSIAHTLMFVNVLFAVGWSSHDCRRSGIAGGRAEGGRRTDPIAPGVAGSCPRQRRSLVCDLTEPVGLSQPTVSHHLKILVDAGVLEREQRGKWAYYRLVPETLTSISQLLTPPTSA